MRFKNSLAIAMSTMLLWGCGGGGDSSGTATPSSTLSISGTAATGLAIEGGTVNGKCKAGVGTTSSRSDGTYILQISGGQLPCIVQINNPADSTTLHSVVTGNSNSAIANITPLTELATARVLGTDPSTFFAGFDATTAAQKVTAERVKAAQNDIALVLAPIVDVSGIGDFISAPFKAATPGNMMSGDTQDKLLDALKLKLNGNQMGLIAAALSSNQAPDTIKQNVDTMAATPVAVTGPEQSVETGTTITLDSSGSSVGAGESITFTWTLVSKPATSAAVLSSQSAAKPSLVPDLAGTYIAMLVVADGKGQRSAPSMTTVIANANVPFMTTPVVVATPFASGTPFNNEHWKIEYAGSETGYCDALYVNQYGNSYTSGMCTSAGKVLGDFGLSGIVDANGAATLNMHITSSTTAGAIFRGNLHLDGTGSGTWAIPNSTAQGTWTATRYAGNKTYTAPSLTNPDAGSFASLADGLSGIWRRPTITNYPEFALLIPGGETAWQVTAPTGGFAKMFGIFVTQDSTWSLGNGSALYNSSSIQDVQASGTFIARSQIVGTMRTATGNPVTLSFDSYSTENALALTLKDLSGTYVGGGAVYIGEDGTVIGTTGDGQQGCKIRGKISEISPGAKVNLFRAKITYYGSALNPSSCQQTQAGPEYDGFVFIQTTGTDRYLYSLLRPSLLSKGANPTIGMYYAYLVGHPIR